MSYKILTQNLKTILTQNSLYYLIYGRGRQTPPISAGTEYFVCNICDGVATEVAPPHPVWTDGAGRDIILLDTVALGGENGLNN